MNTAWTLLAAIVVVYAGVLGALWRFQERIVFQPPVNPESPDAGTSTLSFTSADGIRLVAHVIEPPGAKGRVVVAFHGNAMISRWMIPWARELSRRFNAIVVVPEYRGYDGMAGVPTYEGTSLDAAAALAAVRERFGVAAEEVVFYGHSLGTAIAIELAAVHPPRALLLESPFTSARDMADRWRAFGAGLFWRSISRVHYDTRRLVSELNVPAHVAHGERDIIIPARMGRAVHSAARNPGRLLLVPDAGHNDVAAVGGAAYWQWIEEAIRPVSQ